MITLSSINKRKAKSVAMLLALPVSLFTMMTSCNDLEDKDHYSNLESQISSEELVVVNQSSQEYLQNTAEYSQMNELFEQQAIYKELNEKGQLSTLLVVDNDDFKEPEGDAEKVAFITRSHVSDVSVSPANLKTEKNDMRIMMWHGKYVNVDLDSLAMNHGKIAGHIMFNTSAVKKVVKTNTGYIYVLSNMINTPQSLNDFINALDDNYSIIRDTIKASGGKVFDKANSKPIGINAEGNTIYDTVWIYTNTHFESVGMDLTSESLTATMLLPSNDVINATVAEAKARLEQWGLVDSWDSDREYPIEYTLTHWIMDACFFNKKYSSADITNPDPENIITSVFHKDWKTSVQTVDATPTELSNGVVYQVKKMRIPNNVLIYRLKEEFYIYENCTAEQKDQYFKMTNMLFSKCDTKVDAWTPLSGAWPIHQNRCLLCKVGDDATGEWQLDFTPVKRIYDEYYSRQDMIKKGVAYPGANIIGVQPYLVPPGKYRLGFGSDQGRNMDLVFTILAKGVEAPLATSNTISLGSTTTYHYDRGATMSDRYPEGFNSGAEGMSSKAGNYDTDGGLVLEEIVVPDVNGDGSPVQLLFRILCTSGWNGKTEMLFNHWCLRPTKDNY